MDYLAVILLILIMAILALIITSIGVYKVKNIKFKFENLNETDIIPERFSLNERLKAKIKKINLKLKPTTAESQLRKLHQKLKNKSSNKSNTTKDEIESDKQELARSFDNSLNLEHVP